ncbi:MAG: hypothetical protein LBQ47_01980 [Endomicrobium sp.]|nr:hypothetical protein [Endomicrobium sp.]
MPVFYCSHLHYPDKEQTSILNTKYHNIKIYSDDRNTKYQSQYNKQFDAENINKGIWHPRIWLQKIDLKIKHKILAITFMENIIDKDIVVSMLSERENQSEECSMCGKSCPLKKEIIQ